MLVEYISADSVGFPKIRCNLSKKIIIRTLKNGCYKPGARTKPHGIPDVLLNPYFKCCQKISVIVSVENYTNFGYHIKATLHILSFITGIYCQ
jgi:hypothetical protein